MSPPSPHPPTPHSGGEEFEEGGVCYLANATSGALGRHDVAEQLPRLVLEARELDRLDRIEVGPAGADGAAGQQQREADLLEVSGLLPDVLAASVVPAPLQDLAHHGLLCICDA